jgi:hypothetical protein
MSAESFSTASSSALRSMERPQSPISIVISASLRSGSGQGAPLFIPDRVTGLGVVPGVLLDLVGEHQLAGVPAFHPVTDRLVQADPAKLLRRAGKVAGAWR